MRHHDDGNSIARLQSRLLYEERYICAVRGAHPLNQHCRNAGAVLSLPTCHGLTRGRPVCGTHRPGPGANRTQRRVVLSAPGFLILPEILKTDDLIAVVPERVLCGRMAGSAPLNRR